MLALQKLSKIVVVQMFLPAPTKDFTYLLKTLNFLLASKTLRVAGTQVMLWP